MRRYVLLLGAVFIAEAALYSALAPLLASYARNGEISKISAGVLTGAYAFGLVPGSLAALWLTSRIGTRLTTIAGVALFSAATAWFGVTMSIETQTVARTVQGLAAGCMWGGALAWLIDLAPERQRGEFVGIAAGASAFGSVIGPAVGILAVGVDKEATYIGCAALIAALIVPLYRTPPRRPVAGNERVREALSRSWSMRLGALVTLLAASAFAILLTLVPLRLGHAGARPSVVGGVFLIVSLLSAFLSRSAGRFSDRQGAVRTVRIGLLLTIVPVAALALKLPLVPLVLSTVLATVALFVGIFVPAERLLFDGAAEQGFSPGASAPVLILCVAIGETLGAPVGAGIATITSESVLFLGVAAAMTYGAYALGRDGPRPRRTTVARIPGTPGATAESSGAERKRNRPSS